MSRWQTHVRTGKRAAVAVLLALVLSLSTAVAPRPAYAIFGIADISFTTIVGNVWQAIQDAAKFAWAHGAAIAYKNAASYFANQVAYDTAVWLGSGGNGQQPLFVTEGWGSYLKNVGDAAAGEFLDTFARESSQGHPGKCTKGSKEKLGQACTEEGENFHECGVGDEQGDGTDIGFCTGAVQGTGFTPLGLCSPQRLGSFKLAILTPLFQERRPLAPSCTLSKIEQNWSAYLSNPRTALNAFNVVLDPRQNDLGVALQIRQNFSQQTAAATEAEKLTLAANKGLKNITEKITKFIKTPIAREEKQIEQPIETASQQFLTYTGDIAADALGTFTNTLAARLMKRLMEGDVPSPSGKFNPGSSGNAPSGGVAYAVQVNSSIKTPTLVNGERIDVISDFSNCPDDQTYAALNNCTIDGKFAQALRQAQAGQAFTVQEAIDKGVINGGWVFKRDRPLSVRTPDAWYLSDLRKLRRARFIPVGWELAAEQFAGTDVTLQQVIGRRDQGYGSPSGEGFNGSSSPYYHLIDPNWVLKAPEEQCRIQGYGQQLEPRGSNRQQSCVDTQNCVAENADGTCQAWGYCTREKNIWRFNGDSCEFPAGSGYSPFATCQAFTARDGTQATYLQNSLTGYDDGTCTSDSVGCRWYSTAFSPAPATPAARYNAQARLYLKNANSISCDPASEGCHQFLRLTNLTVPGTACGAGDTACLVGDVVAKVTPPAATDTYDQYAQVATATLKEAPTYLNCYDSDPSNDSPLCANYLKACLVDEVGCQLYKSSDGSPAVPGIKGSSCPAECVGFNSYDQLASFFEPAPAASAPVVTAATFIPSTAQACPASVVGCEEFTNVQTEAREYYSELRQCMVPDGTEHTYYTWVGSNLTGYQLKVWTLKPESANLDAAPTTTDSSGTSATSTCGDANHDDFTNGTNPDCKQFYDTSGTIHYRLASKTYTASSSCTQYRATNVTQANCNPAITGGTWDPTAVPTPACFFNAIPQEGRSCSAQYLGCREYRGPTANNVRLVFPTATFGDTEAGVTADTTALGGFTPGTNSPESVAAFGHSLYSGVGNRTITKDITGKLTLGKQYTLSFWVKSTAATSSISASFNTAPALSLGTVGIGGDWQVYTLGPVVLNSAALPTNLTITSSNEFYIDNVALREIGDTFFVRKRSWVTPATCQAPRDLRCASYTDSTNTKVALTDFSKICRAAVVGCEALVDTRNSNSPRATTATSGDQTVVTPADQLTYRVYDATYACAASAKACLKVGEPTLDTSGAVQNWTDRFIKLDPDTLDGTNPLSPLCSSTQNACEEFKDSSGASHFFKDPGNGTCEYKQVDNLHGYDWYKKGTFELCNLVANPSFEQANDAGVNLLSNGSFEIFDSAAAPPTFTGWTVVGGIWNQSTERYQGSASAQNGFNGGSQSLTQRFIVSVGQTYTARAWVKADAHLRRTLRVTDCGVNVSDYTESQGAWEKLQATFTPTTRSCKLSLTTTPGADLGGTAFYDAATVTLADVFTGWQRNGGTGPADPPLTTLTAHESVAGQYWGGTALEVQSTDQIYSGVWSKDIKLAPPNPARTLTLTARVYVPNIPRNSTMLDWSFTYRTTPAGASVVQPGFDLSVTPASPKGQWLTKRAVVVLNAGVSALSVGVITNSGSSGACTPATCRAGQVVYVDQVTVTESPTAPAYLCPADQVSCKAFRDPSLTRATYYYLDNSKLDRTSCSGRVGEKDGCLLFTDLSSAQLSWNSTATYAAGQNDSTAPVSADPNDSNTILKVARDRVCGEWLSCQSESTQFVNGKTSSVCYALGRCNEWGAAGVGKCGNWLNPEPNPQPLNTVSYQARGTDWSSQEYSGYSIPNLYPIAQLTQKNYGVSPTKPDVRLTYLSPSSKKCNGTGSPCATVGVTCADGTICQYEDKGLAGSGPFDTSGQVSSSATASKACRVYPEADSPFPDSVVKDWQPSCDSSTGTPCDPNSPVIQLVKSKETGYKDANTCQQGRDCECFYRRATYSNSDTLFYGLTDNPDSKFALDGGATSRLKRNDFLLGLRGYCLERDTSRLINGTGADSTNACLTWLPVDTVSGDLSIYDYAPEAGYQSSGGDTYYCSQAAGLYNLGKTGSGVGSQTGGYTIQSHLNDAICAVDSFGNATSVGNCSATNTVNLGVTDGITDVEIATTGYAPGTTPGFTSNYIFTAAPAPDSALVEAEIAGIYIQRPVITGTYCITGDDWPEGNLTLTSTPGSALVHMSASDASQLSNYDVWAFGANGVTVDPGPNRIEAAVLFDKTTGKLAKLYGYLDHNCQGSGGAGYRLMYNVKEFCSEAVQASQNLENKAWTDRVLRRTDYQVTPAAELGFTSPRTSSPYGRFASSGQPVGPLVVSDRPGINVTSGSSQYTTVTTPYACSPGTCGGASGMCIQGTKGGVSQFGQPCKSSAECEDSSNPNGVCTGYFSGSCSDNTNLSCITTADCRAAGSGGTCGSYRSMVGNSATAGRNSVSQVFAKEFGPNPDGSGYIQKWSGVAWVDDLSKPVQDVSGPPVGKFGGNVPTAPRVTQVVFDPVTKAPSEGGNGITLQTSSGTFTSGNVVLTSPAPVTALFYSYNPNGEQMPLTKVWVDWQGDHASALSGADGKYKNHKHTCTAVSAPTCTAGANLGLPCQNDAQCGVGGSCNLKFPNPRYTFGDSSQACVDDSPSRQGYFSFTRVFTCTTSDGSYNPNALGAGQGACVFTPQTFVQDNWGWCTNGYWDNDPGQADSDCSLSNGLTWVKFAGQVYVKP